jgi:hypothetical protein
MSIEAALGLSRFAEFCESPRRPTGAMRHGGAVLRCGRTWPSKTMHSNLRLTASGEPTGSSTGPRRSGGQMHRKVSMWPAAQSSASYESWGPRVRFKGEGYGPPSPTLQLLTRWIGSTATSPHSAPTSSGWPTSLLSRLGRALRMWPLSSMCSLGSSSAGASVAT